MDGPGDLSEPRDAAVDESEPSPVDATLLHELPDAVLHALLRAGLFGTANRWRVFSVCKQLATEVLQHTTPTLRLDGNEGQHPSWRLVCQQRALATLLAPVPQLQVQLSHAVCLRYTSLSKANITRLELVNISLTYEVLRHELQLSCCPQLRTLALTRCPIKWLDGDWITQLGEERAAWLPGSLTHLVLTPCHGLDDILNLLAATPEVASAVLWLLAPQLRRLDIAGKLFGPVAAQLPLCTQLQHVQLSKQPGFPGYADAELLHALRGLPSLHSITAEGLEATEGFRPWPSTTSFMWTQQVTLTLRAPTWLHLLPLLPLGRMQLVLQRGIRVQGRGLEHQQQQAITHLASCPKQAVFCQPGPWPAAAGLDTRVFDIYGPCPEALPALLTNSLVGGLRFLDPIPTTTHLSAWLPHLPSTVTLLALCCDSFWRSHPRDMPPGMPAGAADALLGHEGMPGAGQLAAAHAAASATAATTATAQRRGCWQVLAELLPAHITHVVLMMGGPCAEELPLSVVALASALYGGPAAPHPTQLVVQQVAHVRVRAQLEALVADPGLPGHGKVRLAKVMKPFDHA